MAGVNVRAEAKRLDLRAVIDEALPDRVIGDPVKVGQILTNLLANAVKFTERGCVALTIRVRHKSAGRVELGFSVADTGIGIAPDQLEHVFEEFAQASYDIGSTFGGSGLGLTIVRRLLNLHGSKISVESAVGKGSIFTFDLPFELAEDQQAVGPVGGDGDIAESQLLRGVRVLLVEDNAFDAFVLARSLDSWGVVHDVVPTIDDAIGRVRGAPPDVVLLSTRVSVDPEGAATSLRAAAGRADAPPVVALARSSVERSAMTTTGAIADFVLKPVDPSVLFATLASLKP
jgi:CheY-like chemotaxis protein